MSEHAQPEMHPDLDALSAFAEGTLVEHERLACLDHLAECAQCREIVYLTQAAEAADAEPVKEPKPDPAPFWKRWLTPIPVLSTMAVAALAAVSTVVYRHQAPPPPQPELMAKVEAPPPALSAPALSAPLEKKAAPRKPEFLPRSLPLLSRSAAPPPPLKQSGETSAAPAAPPSAAPAPSQPAGIAGVVTDSGAANSFTSSTNTSGQYAVPGVPPGQDERRTNPQELKQNQSEIQLQPAQVARADSVLTTGNVSAPVEVTPQVRIPMAAGGGGRGGRAGLGGAVLATAPAMFKTALPSAANGDIMLRADAAGALSRSKDAGKSWQNISGKWQGKIIRLMTPPHAPGAGDAVFQLNTDTGEVWFSRDGDGWTPATPVH
ncbi:MAG TPA: hypothetical protein VGM43_16010 [Bryobacteraceae bacterium]|jgi:hypothetical protein